MIPLTEVTSEELKSVPEHILAHRIWCLEVGVWIFGRHLPTCSDDLQCLHRIVSKQKGLTTFIPPPSQARAHLLHLSINLLWYLFTGDNQAAHIGGIMGFPECIQC